MVSLLTSMILKKGPLRSTAPPELSPLLLSVVLTCLKIVNNIASLDLVFLQVNSTTLSIDIQQYVSFSHIKPSILLFLIYTQTFLGAEDYQVEMFHLISYLLAYCASPEQQTSSDSNNNNPNNNYNLANQLEKKHRLLNELILMIGYYTLQNEKNQEVVQWGKSPTILQRLCYLPFQYFIDTRYVDNHYWSRFLVNETDIILVSFYYILGRRVSCSLRSSLAVSCAKETFPYYRKRWVQNSW